MNLRRLTLVLASAALMPAAAQAAGFGISEFDSVYSGRAYAGSALAESPSVVYWNPAGMTALDGLQLSLGVAGIMPKFKYVPIEGGPGEETTSNTAVVTPPNLSITYKLFGKGHRDLSVGFGVYVPYGSTFSWPDDWVARQQIRELSLQVIELTPAVAFKLNKLVSIGGGVRIAPSNVYLRRAVGFGTEAEGEVELAGRGTGVGGFAGISIGPMDGLSLAFNWRSRMRLDFAGDSNFTFAPPFDTMALDRDVEAKLILPDKVVFGLAYEILPKRLVVMGDVTYETWSTYDELKIVFIDENGVRDPKADPKDSRDIVSYKAGLEYKFGELAAVRVGYLFDPYITPEEYVGAAPPDSNTHVVSLGGSYYWKWLGFHAHVLGAFFAPRESLSSAFPAEWQGGLPGGAKAYIYGLSVSAKLDAAPVME